MSRRPGEAIALGGVLLLLAGCGGTPAKAPPAKPVAGAANAKDVILHVPGMVKRLNLF
jgi:hypothetical protein